MNFGDSLSTTIIIVMVTCAISYLAMQNGKLRTQLIFHPATIKRHNQWYRFLSSGFIHADFLHLAINMFVLWSFGTAVEQRLYPAFLGGNATLKFLILYFGGIVVASYPSYQRHQNNHNYSALGASGGVSAVVFAAIVFYPWQNLYLYGAVPIPQILGGAAYLYYSWYQDKRGTDNIGHMAHFAGAVWGMVFTCAMNPELIARFLRKTLEGPSWI